MTLCYSVIPGEAIIVRMGEILEGVGRLIDVNWDRLNCTDCVWMVPGTGEWD